VWYIIITILNLVSLVLTGGPLKVDGLRWWTARPVLLHSHIYLCRYIL